MKRARILKGFFCKKGVLGVLFLCFFCSAGFVFASDAFDGSIFGTGIGGIGKKESIRSVAVELLDVGIEEYNQALFGSAEKTLLKAEGYKRYLSGEQRSRLNRYLKGASEAAVRRKGVFEHIEAADKLVREGKPIRAKAHLREINGSELLTRREKKFVKEGLEKINQWLAEEEKRIKELYGRSVELYNAGQLENARAGFIRVARSGLLVMPDGRMSEDYIHKIDSVIGKTVGPFTITDEELFERQAKGEFGQAMEQGLLGRRTERRPVSFGLTAKRPEEAYVEAISRKRKLVQGYTKALVSDSVTKARDYIDVGKFYRAQQEVEKAKKVLDENQLYLEDEVYIQYNTQLEKLEEEIIGKREKWLGGFSGNNSFE